jgi:hypothetical protein
VNKPEDVVELSKQPWSALRTRNPARFSGAWQEGRVEERLSKRLFIMFSCVKTPAIQYSKHTRGNWEYNIILNMLVIVAQNGGLTFS